MRKYTTLLLFFLLTAALYAQQTKTYCNNRFDFCVQYPAELKTDEGGSVNADGIILEAEGGVTIFVSGSHNVMDWTPERIFEFARADFADAAEVEEVAVENIGTEMSEQGFEARFSAGNSYEYCRMWNFGDAYLVITITGPEEQAEKIEALKEAIQVTPDS